MAKASSANFGSWPARRQRRRRDERRRADLLEGVGVAVEGELAQRPTQRRPEAAGHREHRPADLDRPLVVEDAERGARLPVRHALVLGELVGQAERSVDDGVVGVGRAVGGVGVGQVGDARAAGRAARRRRASCSSASCCSCSPSARLSRRQLVGGRGVAGAAAARPTCLDSSLTLARAASRSAVMLAQPGVERGGVVELVEQRGPAPPGRSPPARRRGRCAAGGRRSQGRDATGRGQRRVRGSPARHAGELALDVVVGRAVVGVTSAISAGRHRARRRR